MKSSQRVLFFLLLTLLLPRGDAWSAPSVSEDVVLRALEDELQRSMTLRLEDLAPPYFVQHAVEDTTVYRISAAYGALLISDQDHSRDLHAQVRVGNYELDNSNFSGRGRRDLGGSADLPTDDDYLAL